MYLTVDDVSHHAFRNPAGIACTLWQIDGLYVRSITVCERATGLTSNYRDSECDAT
ncbi:hypothetical protein FHT44_005163 [Mycolicibacterium sp. BK634]|uniref:hypothetical protein n=1 Tax=Mycolicibacterium sp. BK634 TaxID=2587099 RepID=UPI0017BD2EB1|nr:hypothetical protein [Mycolicibacterium sp. BK634]MBB3752651.1 hypothetical protein [Mycolicibacterium sp. BK634]